jgi:hypothetical protein
MEPYDVARSIYQALAFDIAERGGAAVGDPSFPFWFGEIQGRKVAAAACRVGSGGYMTHDISRPCDSRDVGSKCVGWRGEQYPSGPVELMNGTPVRGVQYPPGP